MLRKVARPNYDAIVELEPMSKGETPSFAYVLVKTTYDIKFDRAYVTEPEPLQYDIYRDETLSPKLPPGSDFWISKTATDVVIQGSAFAPNGKAVSNMEVSARVGEYRKRIAVFGRRALEWDVFGQIRIASPEKFVEMPLTYFNAYGGLDPRISIPEADEEEYLRLSAQGLVFDHPGAYPRNIMGKGYLVSRGPVENFEMPNLEDPDDLLTRQRMVVGRPELWYRQPLPWCFDWTHPLMFPRLKYAGLDAWFPCNDYGGLPEVRKGILPGNQGQQRNHSNEREWEFYQEASLGMVFRRPIHGQQVTLVGMNPEQITINFLVPPIPSIEIEVDGKREHAKPYLTNLVIRPAEKKFYTVYFARTANLPRSFIPEIHDQIPIAARVNNDVPIKYHSPKTVRDRLKAAVNAQKANKI